MPPSAQRDWDIAQKNSRGNHPQTCDKVERFQQTLKKWLRSQPHQPDTLEQLQTLLDQFRHEYNHTRPHKALPQRAVPAAPYTALPKATPSPQRRAPDSHDGVRVDRIDTSGKVTLRHDSNLYSIAVGRTHARTRVLLLVHDLDITILDRATGEILRQLTLDTTRRYQPMRPPDPK